MGIANDTITSVKVGRNVAIVGYKHTEFASVNFFSDKDVIYLKGPDSKNPLGGSVIPIGTPGGGDAISSIKVIKIVK